ncbi:uncharacterized protein [Dermacentor albipictus]|uniref:uncharacterized protein isoform X2 n=1 Tax=Dermacentor albipictus TaxID=60249 RepID=UPI0038FCEEF5
MGQCYPLIKAFIHSSEPVHSANEIKEMWPLLFKKEDLHDYFQRLRGVRMDGRLSIIPRDVVLVLTSFLHSNTGNDAVLEWSSKITQAETSLGDKDAASVSLIPLVVSYFKDDLSQLVQVHEISQAGRGGTSRILSSLSSVAGMTDALRRMRPLHFTVLSVYGSAASPGARQLNPVHLVPLMRLGAPDNGSQDLDRLCLHHRLHMHHVCHASCHRRAVVA